MRVYVIPNRKRDRERSTKTFLKLEIRACFAKFIISSQVFLIGNFVEFSSSHNLSLICNVYLRFFLFLTITLLYMKATCMEL